MGTKVTVKYTPSQNVSVTTRNGVISKVTLWTTGVRGSTERLGR